MRPDLPIVFLTGYADLRLFEAEQERFVLQKPIDETDLVARIGEALRQADEDRIRETGFVPSPAHPATAPSRHPSLPRSS